MRCAMQPRPRSSAYRRPIRFEFPAFFACSGKTGRRNHEEHEEHEAKRSRKKKKGRVAKRPFLHFKDSFLLLFFVLRVLRGPISFSPRALLARGTGHLAEPGAMVLPGPAVRHRAARH